MVRIVRSEDPPRYGDGPQPLTAEQEAEAKRLLAELDRAPDAHARVRVAHEALERARRRALGIG